MHKNYKFCESLHRFLGRPSLLVVFVRNHGVHSSMRAGQRSDCIVLTFCTICCLRFRWRSHQSVNLYFAASSSLRQVDLGRNSTPTVDKCVVLRSTRADCLVGKLHLGKPTTTLIKKSLASQDSSHVLHLHVGKRSLQRECPYWRRFKLGGCMCEHSTCDCLFCCLVEKKLCPCCWRRFFSALKMLL